MFSFKVKFAIQILAELTQAGFEKRRLNITELRKLCNSNSHGFTVTMAQLRRKQWIESINSRYKIVEDLTRKTLYDLIMAMDEGLFIGYPPEDIARTVHRDKYVTTAELEAKLSEELEERFRNILLYDLLELSGKKPEIRHIRRNTHLEDGRMRLQ